MKTTSAILISLPTLIVGFLFHEPYLWIPSSILIAGVIDSFTREWWTSNRLGSMRNLSALLKTFFGFIGFYATLGQIACICLVVWWFIFK